MLRPYLFLSTTPFLTRAIRLYERLGFRRTAAGPRDLFGTPLFAMVKDLRPADQERIEESRGQEVDMSLDQQRIRATKFRELHRTPPLLVLPNAWDASSARIFEDAGFPAIATTSAGVAATLGYPDGEHVPLEEMLRMARRIVEAVAVPVSVDLEKGYGDTPAAVEESCRAVLVAGAVGINIEDGTGDAARPLTELPLQLEKIAAARAAGGGRDVALVINARTDVFLDRVGPPEARLGQAVERLNAYRDAGADCLFVPGVTDREVIAAIVRAVGWPLNVLAVAATPPIAELAALGVARVTVGSGPMRATAGLVRRIAYELRHDGTYRSFTEGAMTYDEVNELFSGRAR